MAYDEDLAQRVRTSLGARSGFTEKKMFGGLCFLLNGHMVCGVMRDEIMVRVGAEGHDEALRQPHAREMDFTGRAMRGMVYVEPEGLAESDDLDAWVGRGFAHAASLPPKAPKPPKASTSKG